MSEFGGLWKQENKPLCTKSVRDFTDHVEVGHHMEEVHTASKITDSDLKPIASLHSLRSDCKVMAIVQDTSHPANHLFQPLPSGRRYRAMRAGTSRSFFFFNSKTKLAANVPKQDPNTQKVKKNTDFNRAAQNQHSFLCVWMFEMS